MKDILKDVKRQWYFSAIVVLSLAVGAAFGRGLDLALSSYFRWGGLSVSEVALINTLEMGLIPVFGVLAVGFGLEWPKDRIWALAWKVFVVGAAMGSIVGTTWAMGWQHATCGFIH
ncbi:MAG: hypothetical protein JW937_02325 [Candidatus Omnitrophica bacterium]|nr:hypothetical protein [Candidatus Omnitrophota bacterium]